MADKPRSTILLHVSGGVLLTTYANVELDVLLYDEDTLEENGMDEDEREEFFTSARKNLKLEHEQVASPIEEADIET